MEIRISHTKCKECKKTLNTSMLQKEANGYGACIDNEKCNLKKTKQNLKQKKLLKFLHI